MQFSIRLLLFATLCGAFVVNAMQNRKQRAQYDSQTQLLIEASRGRERALKLFDQRADFQRRFLELRQIRKAEAEEALAQFRAVAERNSHIEPDDSGRWFMRRLRQPGKIADGIRVWVPEQAKLELAVGFTDRQPDIHYKDQKLSLIHI